MRLYRQKYRGPDGEGREGKVWRVRYYVHGKVKDKSLGTRDKRAAELIAADLVRKAELRIAGVSDPFEEHRGLPLADHLADFETTIKSRGVVARYVADRLGCLRAHVGATGAKLIGDLDLARASEWLGDLKERGLSARSVNRHYQALRQFGRWLVKARRSPFDPFDGLRPLNEAEDRRRVRRALTADEAARLLAAARTRPLAEATAQRNRSGVSEPERLRLTGLGEARALVYALALGTGLRRGELKRLRWCDLDLVRGLVTVPAASAKSRREQTVELHARLLVALKAAKPQGVDPMAPVVARRLHPTTRTFHADLKAARIDARDAEGRVVDFHALRTTFVSWLGATGAHPRTAQALARHANIETTMERYTDLRLFDLKAAVDRLPLPALVEGDEDATPAESTSLPASLSPALSVRSVAAAPPEAGEAATSRNPRFSRSNAQQRADEMVGVGGFEPPTYSSQS